MHHLVAMRLSQSSAQLQRDFARLPRRQLAALEPIGESLTIQKLHGDEINASVAAGSGVNLENLADIRVADLSRAPHLGRKSFAIFGLGAFDRDSPLQPLVH